jgi:hypothetical protein
MDEVQAFYEGITVGLMALEADERLDHMDVLVDALKDGMPKGGSIEGLMDYIKAADDGNVIEVFLVEKQGFEDVGNGETGPMPRAWRYVVLRIIDLQAGPEFLMTDARQIELHKGEVEDGTSA